MRILLIDDSSAYQADFSLLLADAKLAHSTLDVANGITDGARKIASGEHGQDVAKRS
jgi:hypothetical protein